MTPATFTKIAKRLFPREEFSARQTPYAMLSRPQFLAVDHHTLTRYGDGRMDIPKKVEWALYGLQMCKAKDGLLWRKLVEEG